MSDEIISSSMMMVNLLNNNSFGSANNMTSVWKKVVSKIHTFNDDENSEKHIPLGERLAGNTRVIDLKNGILLIETDHSGWIQYLRMYQKFIITGLNRELPNLKIKTFAFRMAGSKFSLNDNYEKELEASRKKLLLKLNEEDKIAEKYLGKEEEAEKEKNPNKLPPELLEKIESLKRSMLTNSEK